MTRIVKIEGIALLLLVSSTSQAGLPAHVTAGLGALAPAVEQRLVPRARHMDEVHIRPATPAAVDLALYEAVERFEQAVETTVTSGLTVVVALVDELAGSTQAAANDNARIDDGSSNQPAGEPARSGPPVAALPGTSSKGPAASKAPAGPKGPAGPGDLPARFAISQHGPFDDLVLGAARRWRLDPFLLKGLLANESNLEPVRAGKRRYGEHNGERIVVSGGAIGIAQFCGGGVRAVQSLRAKRRRRGERVLGFDFDRALVPQEAIFAAAELLAHLLRRFGRDGGITAYNTGAMGGLAVYRLGFWGAREAGKLRRNGIFHLQGERFLLNVLRRTNHYRRAAGLPPLTPPRKIRTRQLRQIAFS